MVHVPKWKFNSREVQMDFFSRRAPHRTTRHTSFIISPSELQLAVLIPSLASKSDITC